MNISVGNGHDCPKQASSKAFLNYKPHEKGIDSLDEKPPACLLYKVEVRFWCCQQWFSFIVTMQNSYEFSETKVQILKFDHFPRQDYLMMVGCSRERHRLWSSYKCQGSRVDSGAKCLVGYRTEFMKVWNEMGVYNIFNSLWHHGLLALL